MLFVGIDCRLIVLYTHFRRKKHKSVNKKTKKVDSRKKCDYSKGTRRRANLISLGVSSQVSKTSEFHTEGWNDRMIVSIFVS